MILEEAKRVIRVEAEALLHLEASIDQAFEKAVQMILNTTGRVVVTGMGKSGLVGQKIASTMASTGTPAFFLHPAEGIHGDLGMIMKGDVVIAISNSGETDEVVRILPIIKRLGGSLIAMAGNPNSTLAKSGDIFLDISVKEEACPLGLAPTASTTVTMAMGDAIAVALLVSRGFKAEDFAMFHPGGTLGRRLLLKVEDIMHSGEGLPLVGSETLMREALFTITSKGLGITGVTSEDGALLGVITDGDLRRALGQGLDIINLPASALMKKGPKRIRRDELAARALQQMEQYSITSLFVFSDDDAVAPVGIVHLHDLLKAGIA
ncbi:KpsF/GutQ family sugar-phosphate isomerase [Geomonas sp. Red69]|uniref:KpsF/GutQ family sugar-phosphate isomerase n=1 Tax=Geomonas diazotrophica TaxID=2843197 RepID=A0ABX8JC40_9BACT|nr:MULTISPECIES: KpsF/GutQ family sugar-phosphate isomerase [Geomonas]MBU5636092.1 KpsF/GutQ family sugar-phosphate isomerase [Geomonas diazotrophica]QWV95993.1 KpsF/GutQ family sugar-phosphate isomerase [Geomonas nitrogeniifigens]QXE85060.1 KpsF/GutQ family sugar-phosphate isomerase [Geomonas nitrogeniifigens]